MAATNPEPPQTIKEHAPRVNSSLVWKTHVLYPLAMTDALLSLATAGFFSAKWTTMIEVEWIRSLERHRPDLVGKLNVRRDSMRDAIADWDNINRQRSCIFNY